MRLEGSEVWEHACRDALLHGCIPAQVLDDHHGLCPPCRVLAVTSVPCDVCPKPESDLIVGQGLQVSAVPQLSRIASITLTATAGYRHLQRVQAPPRQSLLPATVIKARLHTTTVHSHNVFCKTPHTFKRCSQAGRSIAVRMEGAGCHITHRPASVAVPPAPVPDVGLWVITCPTM